MQDSEEEIGRISLGDSSSEDELRAEGNPNDALTRRLKSLERKIKKKKNFLDYLGQNRWFVSIYKTEILLREKSWWIYGKWEWIKATLDEKPYVLTIPDTFLRAIGQVVFAENPISGLLVILALCLENPVNCVFGMIALLGATLLSYALNLDHGERRAGLLIFNSFLVGLAMQMFLSDDIGQYFLVGAVFINGAFCLVLSVYFGKYGSMERHFPFLTIPFNVCTLWILAGAFDFRRLSISPALSGRLPDRVAGIETCFQAVQEGDCIDITFDNLLDAIFRGFGQIFFANNATSGFFVALAMGLYSWKLALAGLVGGAVGLATGFVLGVDGYLIYNGLYMYNPILSAAAIGGGIFCRWNWISWIAAIAAATVTCPLFNGMQNLLGVMGLPSFTLAFCIATSAILGLFVGLDDFERADPTWLEDTSLWKQDSEDSDVEDVEMHRIKRRKGKKN